MLVCLMAHDKPGSLDVRKANRDAHLAYLKDTGCVTLGGPFRDSQGDMCGSMLVLDLPDMAAAEAWAAEDPYAKAGLFETVTLREWIQVLP
ncbi:YciI family protein [Sulfitobacter noctilucae]|uniref:YciI family protein n=1 Tax=Sulfitobacter noctilucae TaxID=1342302 RepID=UPI00046A5C64|nr:YciI family protein [Sulfitobacter noctilucae]